MAPADILILKAGSFYTEDPNYPYLMQSTNIEYGRGDVFAMVIAVNDTINNRPDLFMNIEGESTPLQKKLDRIS